MLKIDIICIGKLKERYWKEAETEYLKRLGAYANVSLRELGDIAADRPAAARLAVEKEGVAILAELSRRKDKAYIIALDSGGRDLSSDEMSEKIASLSVEGVSAICFIIGGSHGLSKAVKDASQLLLSFGRKTYPHQLMRVVLLEQIYRSFKIIAGESYHK